MTSHAAIVAVVEAARGLTLAPRGDRWTHLPLCVLDAMYSINANYDWHTLPTVRRYAGLSGLSRPARRLPPRGLQPGSSRQRRSQ